MILKETSQELVIENRSIFISYLCSVLFIILLIYGIYLWITKKAYDWEGKTIGSLAGAATMGLMALLTFEKGFFYFDRIQKRLKWSRTWFFKTHSGEISFDEIQSVIIQTSIGSTHFNPKRRIAFVTLTETIPLTNSYTPDLGEYDGFVVKINAVLGKGPKNTLLESVKAYVQAGNRVGAIRLLMQNDKNLSLAEAKKIAESF